MYFYLGSDHAGYKTKEILQKFLTKKGIKTIDLGPHDEESVDYPDFAEKIGKKVSKDKKALGLLICGTGIGMSISANKINGIRAANPFDVYTAKMAREHNNANVLCLGARTYKPELAKKILKAFIETKPTKEKRHLSRIKKIMQLEKNK